MDAAANLALTAAAAATALFGLIVAAIAAFLVNFEVAFCVYVYRVAFTPPQEEVKLDLRPLNWGLRP